MKIIVPATSANLGPGFDSLGLSIGLFNEIQITREKLTSISIKGEGSDNLYIKKNNTFVNIFNEIYNSLTNERSNFKFSFLNNIPFSRGLGSSSSVIVAAIASAYKMAGFNIQKDRILNKSLIYENHPDNISPATYGGFTVNIVKNGEVFTKKSNIDSQIQAVVVIPNEPISTSQSRTQLQKNYPLSSCISNLSHSSFLSVCFFEKDYQSLRLAAIDKIHEDIRMSSYPILFKIRQVAYENGALMSTLSGSGSSFLNIVFRDDALRLQKKLQDNFPKFRVLLLEFDNEGFKITSKS
ncbi:homoserine kinase [Campylobacter sp. FMV-PI01]|uniref:Homoserine kinase n=1 Tax=Campylobacter portucalensis TaxID=2608384 RepID=A0A6L5WFR3_9BACT|nr:homoserine kinase [Campylobacter portucalensis]MSN95834.1 homoserine kinase [Campylobacter portucalensis]